MRNHEHARPESQLKKKFGKLPRDLPKKMPSLKMSPTALAERTRQLDEYVQAIMEREPRIVQSEDFWAFLEVHLYVRPRSRTHPPTHPGRPPGGLVTSRAGSAPNPYVPRLRTTAHSRTFTPSAACSTPTSFPTHQVRGAAPAPASVDTLVPVLQSLTRR